jgi:hypothetical protein
MSVVIELIPLSDHGRDLLDELEEKTDKGFKTAEATGARTYYLESADSTEAFEPMLDQIDADWREYLTRTGA